MRRRWEKGRSLAISTLGVKTKKFFTAPKTVILLLCLLLIACLAGALIPQSANTPSSFFEAWRMEHPVSFHLAIWFQLNRVFSSFWFLLLVLLMFFSITLSLQGQFRKAWRACAAAPPLFPLTPEVVFQTDAFDAAALRKRFAKRGFQRETHHQENAEGLIFFKNRRNVWGGVIFHGGMLLLILAALLTVAFQKRGFVQLIEGDSFSGRQEDFLSCENGIFSGRFDPGFGIQLEKLSHSYWDTGELKELKSDVIIERRGLSVKKSLTRGESFDIGDVSISQSPHFGYTLKISLSTKGAEGLPTYFSLDMAPAGRPLTGRSDFPTTDYVLEMAFTPDRSGRSPYPLDPSLQLRFMTGEKEAGRAVLKPGEEALVGESRFRFEEIRNWSGLRLTENSFTSLVYGGFLLNTIGILIIFLFPPQEVLVSATKGGEGIFVVGVSVKARTGKNILLADAVGMVKGLPGGSPGKGR
ncbi:MAG: cytochrome c biogenesis protein ResB [Syntrophales bacterium]